MNGLWKATAVGAFALFAASCSDGVGPLPMAARQLATEPLMSTPVNGAGFTTVNEAEDGAGHCANGNPNVNCNIYDGKEFVWLNGGPAVAYVGDGEYFFAVLAPGGQGGNNNPNDGTPNNLSDLAPTTNTGAGDAYTNRIFNVSSGVVSYLGTHDFANNKIRLMPYDDTPNPGGVYIMAICSLADGYPVTPSACKYDAFKVRKNDEPPPPPAGEPGVTKTASGSYATTYTWAIDKAVDKTIVKQVGGTATFTYTVEVTHDGGTIGGWKVNGVITVSNPNLKDLQTVAVDIDGVTDQLSDGTVCTVTNGGPQTLTTPTKDFDYECVLSGEPAADLSNTATVSWSAQFLDNGALLNDGSAEGIATPIPFDDEYDKVDETVDVTDSFNGGAPVSLGSASVGGDNPTTFTYSKTVNVPAFDCVSYDNTATFTATDTHASGSAGQTVTVCGPDKTGGLTMGFWQNKNGQGIISGQAATGVCPSATWLRAYAPFQDLAATATCAKVATYVYNVVKAANAAGAAMNAMLKAQMLATALDVYFSDPTLGGNTIQAPGPIGGVSVDLTKVCKNIGTCSIYENTGGAFGGASSLTVLELLSYAASQSNVGGSIWYGQVKSMQELAKDTFDAINNQKIFAP